jgi:hypothetical protein
MKTLAEGKTKRIFHFSFSIFHFPLEPAENARAWSRKDAQERSLLSQFLFAARPLCISVFLGAVPMENGR